RFSGGSIASASQVDPRVLPVFPLPFIPAQYRWKFDHIRLLRPDLSGRKVGNGLAQKDFNGAQLGDGQANLTKGALVKPIDKLTRSDFFPDIIGVKEHLELGHFPYSACLIRYPGVGCVHALRWK